MNPLIGVLVVLIVVIAVAFVAKYIIDAFFPEPLKLPIMVLVGLLLLLVLIWQIGGHLGYRLGP